MPRPRKPMISPLEIAGAFADPQPAAAWPPILDVPLAAKLLRVSPSTIYDWRSKGWLDGSFRKRGKHLIIFRDRFLDIIFNDPPWSEHDRKH